jgi:hypothetical protein
MICVAVFDGRLERCFKNDRRIKVKTVDARPAAGLGFAHDRRTVQLIRERMLFETPGA